MTNGKQLLRPAAKNTHTCVTGVHACAYVSVAKRSVVKRGDVTQMRKSAELAPYREGLKNDVQE